MNEIIKWIATLILIIGTGVNGLGYYPQGPIILVIGGFLWLFVAVRIKDWPLIITNLVMSTVGMAAIIYTLNSNPAKDETHKQLQEQSTKNR